MSQAGCAEYIFKGQQLIGGLFILNIILLETVRTCGQQCVGKRHSDFRKKMLKEAGEKCSSLQFLKDHKKLCWIWLE